ncbi:hypothetical protein Tco_1233355, partial [Tanacetum coccineum]
MSSDSASSEEVPIEDQPYAVADLPIALSLGYVADSDPEEDHANYPADGGDDDDEPFDYDDDEPFDYDDDEPFDDDDDDDTSDEDKEPFEDEED